MLNKIHFNPSLNPLIISFLKQLLQVRLFYTDHLNWYDPVGNRGFCRSVDGSVFKCVSARGPRWIFDKQGISRSCSALGSDREDDHATFRSDFRWLAPVDAALFLDPDLQSVRVS